MSSPLVASPPLSKAAVKRQRGSLNDEQNELLLAMIDQIKNKKTSCAPANSPALLAPADHPAIDQSD
jgi:hypothetical protein